MIITRTPLRISFVGGGTDFPEYYRYSGGAVVSTAINKYIHVIVNRRFDGDIRVGYSKTEYARRVDDIEHHIVREALKLTGVDSGIDVVYTSEIPPASAGTGLGASSAIAVGVLNALHAFKEEVVSEEQLAREACELEIGILGEPIGKQDQYIAAYGGFNEIVFHPDHRVAVNPLTLSNGFKAALLRKLLLFYTGLPSDSRGVLTEQRRNIDARREELGQMVSFAREFAASLREARFESLGTLLHRNWMHKRTLSHAVSNAVLDAYYERARQAGVVGGKILGSGGGGFFLFYCDEPHQDTVRDALSDLRETPFDFEPNGSRILYASP